MKKLLVILCFSLFFTGCSKGNHPEAQKYSAQLFAMDTVMELTYYGQNDALLSRSEALIGQLDSHLSVTDPGSDIYRLNHQGELPLSEDTAILLGRTLDFCRRTEGALDPSVYPVVKAWGFTTGTHRIPSEKELQSLLPCVDYTQIHLDANTGTASLSQGMEIDLGSVAKGYTADRLAALFREAGISSALLNLGGNVHTLGCKPDGTPWQIGIQNPLGDGFLGILSAQDQAVVTSGGYERYFEGPDGKIYWHIIDPATGRPARTGILSATAVGKEGVYCDALSTGLFVMGEEKAVQFWNTYKDFDMVLVTEDHRILITPGLADAFQLSDTSFSMQVIDGD